MKLPVVLTAAAAEESEEGAAWYENERTSLGARFRLAVLETIDRIQQHPRLYPRIHKRVRRAHVRRFPYLVLYTIEPTVIRIIAVFHGHRDSAEWIARYRNRPRNEN